MSRLRPLLIIVIGLALGIGLGLYLGWVAWPTEFTDANPAVLQETYRQDYARLIAAAYAADNNLPAAQRRVADLGADGRDVVLGVTLDTILQGGDDDEIRQLVRLAADLGLSSPAMTPYLPEATP
jgi:TPR repeat protein